MKGKLSDWASVAEILSGIAVVVTLIFLIAGVRENTAVLRGSAYADFLENLNQLQMSMMVDPALSLLWDSYVDEDTERLSAAQRAQVDAMALTSIRIYEAAFFQWEYGVIGPREWDRISEVGCTNLRRLRAFREELLVNISRAFVSHMDANCTN